MREKIIRNRKNILLTIAFLLALALNIGMRYLATRPRYKTLPEVRLVNQKEESTKGFAIMVPNESGDGYVEYISEDGKWPSEEEGYEFKEAKCMDNNGQLVNNAVTFESGKVTLKTNKTINCTLYFDEKPKEPLEITNVAVDNSEPNQVKLTVTVKGGSGKYTYSVENSCDLCGQLKTDCGNVSKIYNEDTITIERLTHCYTHSFVVKVTDSKGNTADYNVLHVNIKQGSGVGVCSETCTS